MVCCRSASGLSKTNQKDERKLMDMPNFSAWSNENLAKFASDSYKRMQAQQEAIMQMRGDLKDAMVQLRQLLKEKND